MKIDFHVHVFPDEIAKKAVSKLSEVAEYNPTTDGTLSSTLELMKKNNTDAFVLLNIAQTPHQQEKANDFVCSLKCKNVYPFAALHPFSEDWEYQMDKAIDSGLKGVKLHPEYQGFDIDDMSAFKFYQRCAEKGLIMLFHGGYDPAYPFSTRAFPEKAAKVVKAFAGSKIVLAHMGNPLSLYSQEDNLLGKEVYFDISLAYFKIPPEEASSFIKQHGANKFLYATDTPWSRDDMTFEYLKSLSLTDEEKDMILYKNAKNLLNIED